ncbi:MAG: hypothetical protein K0Q49_971 [Haloplasmataceae bacterium]|jgi:predicted NBD/HSP70 family sugar kinase|nr:hypothetical protein [Haloplasmataceae bacterium]
MIEDNRGKILEEIIKHNLISRADLAKKVKLNKATISSHINQLLSQKLVIETEFDISTGGRRPILLSMNKKAGYGLGIDITKDTITSYLLNLNGDIIEKSNAHYELNHYQEMFSKLIQVINQFITNKTVYGLVGVGISVHGLVINNQFIQFNKQLPKYNLYNDLLKVYPTLPISIENNANLGAIAERSYNPNLTENFLYLTILSGLGLGIIFNNNLYSGSNGLAGEFGHTIIEINGRNCNCGNKGCLEQYASIPALLDSISTVKKTKISFDDIKTLLEQNDIEIIKKVKIFTNYLTVGLNNLIQLFNSDKIIIESEVYSEILSKMLQSDFNKINSNTIIEFSTIKENSSALGAAIMQIIQFLKIKSFFKTKINQSI